MWYRVDKCVRCVKLESYEKTKWNILNAIILRKYVSLDHCYFLISGSSERSEVSSWTIVKKSYYLGPYFLFLRKFHLHKVIAAMLNNIFNLSSSSTSFIAWTAEIKIDIEVIIWSMRSSGFRWVSQKILYLHEYISEIKNVVTYASLCIDWKCMIYWQQITQVSYVWRISQSYVYHLSN